MLRFPSETVIWKKIGICAAVGVTLCLCINDKTWLSGENISAPLDTRHPCPRLNFALEILIMSFGSYQSSHLACKSLCKTVLRCIMDAEGWPDNGQPLSWPCNLHLAALQDPPCCPCLSTHTHMHMQTYIEISQAPSPSPRKLTLSACLTRKQAWVLGWSENTDLHKSMLCLLLFHHCPLKIHIWPLHVVCTALHAVALVFSQVNIHADWIASLSASFCASTLSGCKRLLL